MKTSMGAAEDSSSRSVFVFRGIEYVISASSTANGRTLIVEAEDKLTADQWRGKFDAAYIEELTRKTGNFKQFAVFVSMLQSALEKNSDSVMLDLLTYSDLELLRDRKSGAAARPQQNSEALVQQNKRYLILIYSVEFDRIHYPLPLVYQGKPDPVHLQSMVRQLRDEIRKLKSTTAAALQDEDYEQLKEDYEEVLQEKTFLEKELDNLKMQMKESTSFTVSKEVRILKKVVQNLEMEMVKEKNRYQRLISKKSTEIKRLSLELQEVHAKERTLQIRVKSLTNELAIYKRTRTPATPRRNSISNSINRSRSRGVANTSLSLNPSAARNRSQSRSKSRDHSFNRSAFSNRSASSERKHQSLRPHSRSRTPNSRFDPTSYVEEKRQKQRESEQRRKRRVLTGFTPGSEDSSRGRSRMRTNIVQRSGSRDRPTYQRSILRDRSSSAESRRSSNGSITARSRPKVAWDYSTRKKNVRKRSSTPDYERYPEKDSRFSIGGQEYNDNMAEIDARLNALQQYMHELGTCP